MAANSVHAAPAALATTVTAVALAKGAVASGSTLTLIKGALKLMAWTKAKTAAVVAVVTIAGLSVSTIAVKQWVRPATDAPIDSSYPGDWIWEGNSQTLEKVPPILLLRPSTLPATRVPFDMFGNGRYLARGKTVKELLAAVYSQINSEAKLTFLAPLPDKKFDCIVVGKTNWPDALETEIKRQFHLVTSWQPYDSRIDKTQVVLVREAKP